MIKQCVSFAKVILKKVFFFHAVTDAVAIYARYIIMKCLNGVQDATRMQQVLYQKFLRFKNINIFYCI